MGLSRRRCCLRRGLLRLRLLILVLRRSLIRRGLVWRGSVLRRIRLGSVLRCVLGRRSVLWSRGVLRRGCILRLSGATRADASHATSAVDSGLHPAAHVDLVTVDQLIEFVTRYGLVILEGQDRDTTIRYEAGDPDIGVAVITLWRVVN